MDILPKEKIRDLANIVHMSYLKHTYSVAFDQKIFPNRNVIIEILELFREILFPGYLRKPTCVDTSVQICIENLLTEIYEKLFEQISCALSYNIGRDESLDVDKNASHISYEILSMLPKIREFLSCDVQAAFDGDPASESKDEIILSYPGIFAITAYRVSHEMYIRSVPLIPRIMSEYAHNITGIDIHPGAKIGKYFFIDHGTGVVIGETTCIGDNVKIYQGVTLGALSTRSGQELKNVKRHPTIEDDVTIYSGASILGGKTVIGKNVVIGGNAFITQSIPDGTKVSIKAPELLFKDDNIPKGFKT